MSAIIHLDRPHTYFTNLDILTGRVVVQLNSDISISAITVKLEGESRTRLVGPKNPQERSERKKTELEVHKILYKVATVFPDPDVVQHSSPSSSFTLPPGTYEYPFKFKLPFNNSCLEHGSSSYAVSGFRVESHNMDSHVKKTLPPSLSSFPGEAQIHYYIKATVVRPQFYKENMRAMTDFNFLPIEPPRTGNPNEEIYARRQQEFARTASPIYQKKGLFKKRSAPVVAAAGENPPRFSVDARLPNPAILTCNEPIPLRILVRKLSRSSDILFLQLLQIELISYTHIQAHDLKRRETQSTVILSLSNMNVALGTGNDKVGKEYQIDASLWDRLPLPNSIAPSFETCNIRRTYELDIRVGLCRGNIGAMQLGLLVTPLRLQVQVYSGIAPPQALLDALAAEKAGRRVPQSSHHSHEPSSPPPLPFEEIDTLGPTPHSQPSQGSYDDAPPSYEDAMADTLAPLDGPRREYNPPNVSDPPVDTKESVNQGTQMQKSNTIFTSSQPSFDNPRRFSESNESIDLLPTTPRSHASSIPDSFMDELQEPNTVGHDPYPQDQDQKDKSSLDPQHLQPQITPTSTSSSSSIPRMQRSFSMGVPPRKPVPSRSETTESSKT